MPIHAAVRRTTSLPIWARYFYRDFSSKFPLNAANDRSSTGETFSFLESFEQLAKKSVPTSPFSTAATTDTATAATAGSQHSQNVLMHMSKQLQRSGEPDRAQVADRRRRAFEIERMQGREWQRGDVYAPHDLSPAEAKKWRQRQRPNRDVFDILNIDPIEEYKNYPLLSEFMTSMGRIKHIRETGLRPVNQRKIAKAVRRAVGMGLMPSVHVHPEMLRRRGPWYRES